MRQITCALSPLQYSYHVGVNAHPIKKIEPLLQARSLAGYAAGRTCSTHATATATARGLLVGRACIGIAASLRHQSMLLCPIYRQVQ
jgi:hypothetical protein